MKNINFLHIFGFIMSFAYVFFGMMVLMTPFLATVIEDPTYRKILGGVLVGYGLFRVAFYLRKLREKKQP
jgi:cytochrome c biogenesis protein CcdA